ncbi:MAG: tetratricopeptide repeat protein [Acidimicrobiales bacterium]
MADVTDATFATDVLERSKTVPVVVDLWAPWCGPCKTLGPILEKVVGETKGLVELAKVNVDENPQVGQAFQVQSIPAVYAMRDGQVVDGFMGAQGEPEVVAFVQRLLDGSAGAPVGDEAEDSNQAETSELLISEPGVGQLDDAVSAPEPVAAPPAEPVDTTAIEAELEQLLITVKGDDDARERFIALLDQLGPEHPETNTFRRRLATALF